VSFGGILTLGSNNCIDFSLNCLAFCPVKLTALHIVPPLSLVITEFCYRAGHWQHLHLVIKLFCRHTSDHHHHSIVLLLDFSCPCLALLQFTIPSIQDCLQLGRTSFHSSFPASVPAQVLHPREREISMWINLCCSRTEPV